jgi:hypothetical protein
MPSPPDHAHDDHWQSTQPLLPAAAIKPPASERASISEQAENAAKETIARLTHQAAKIYGKFYGYDRR